MPRVAITAALIAAFAATLTIPGARADGPGMWSSAGALPSVHGGGHTGTLLHNGKVLVVGGWTNDPRWAVSEADLYDPITRSWGLAPNMSYARLGHTATLLPNGKVLVVGGNGDICCTHGSGLAMVAELFDPGTGASGGWSAAGSIASPRKGHTATLLPNGKVLIVGGSYGGDIASAELYDPNNSSAPWSLAAPPPKAPGEGHTATLLRNGKVLVVGGWDSTSGRSLNDVQIYDYLLNTWAATDSIGTPRARHTATLLNDGRVLVAGGTSGTVGTPPTAVFEPTAEI